jgi:hypothetical protein
MPFTKIVIIITLTANFILSIFNAFIDETTSF